MSITLRIDVLVREWVMSGKSVGVTVGRCDFFESAPILVRFGNGLRGTGGRALNVSCVGPVAAHLVTKHWAPEKVGTLAAAATVQRVPPQLEALKVWASTQAPPAVLPSRAPLPQTHASTHLYRQRAAPGRV